MKTLVGTLFMIATVTHVVVAGDKPDFSGTWMLDVSRSVMGSEPPTGSSRIEKISHKDPSFLIETTDRGKNITFKYSTDGTETTNSISGRDVTSKAVWEGKPWW